MVANVPAVRAKDDEWWDRAPGTFRYYSFYGEGEEHDVDGENISLPAGLNFVCPCGCGSVLGISFRRWTDPKTGVQQPGPVWTHDGNWDHPTVTPSVLHLDGCRWHGYLTAGEWVSC